MADLLAAGLVTLAAGCGGGKPIEFPGGLEPFDDAVPACPSDESVTVETNRPDEGFVATACGRIDADYAAVTGAIGTPEVGIDRRLINLDECTVTEGVEPEYEVSYAVDTLVHDTIDVQYTLTWRHGTAGEGVYGTRWQMTTTNPYIALMEGSVVTTDQGDGTVTVEMVEHIDALLEEKEEYITQFLEDFYGSIRAAAHGEALPTYP